MEGAYATESIENISSRILTAAPLQAAIPTVVFYGGSAMECCEKREHSRWSFEVSRTSFDLLVTILAPPETVDDFCH